MKVLITCVAGYGHLHPLLPLAAALAQAGHEVAIATGPELRGRAEAAGFTAFDSGLDVSMAFERLPEQFPDGSYQRLEPEEILDWYVPHLFGEILAAAMLDDLEPLVRRWRPDVVVHDSFEFAGPIAAASVGIASISHTLGLRHADRVVDSVAAAVAPLWRRHGLAPDAAAGLYRSMCLDITPPSLQPSASAPHRDRIHPLRPMPQPLLLGERLPAWLEHRGRRRGVPLVYMTLGTNTNADTAMFRSVIDGLRDTAVDVLITIGFGKDPRLFGLLPANVHVENYIPQVLILPHCSLVICHAGAGTTLGALAAGLPLLALPQGADQYVMGDLLRAAGTGLVLVPSAVSPARVRENVAALLHEPSYRLAAGRLQREIAGMPGPDQAVHRIEDVVSRGTPSMGAPPASTR